MPRNRTPDAVWIDRESVQGGYSYRVRWIDPATGRKRSLPAGRDKALARILAADKRRELRGLAAGSAPLHRVSELRNKLPTWMAHRAPGTIAKMQRALDDFVDIVGDLWLAQVTRERVMEFRAKRLAGKSPRVVRKTERAEETPEPPGKAERLDEGVSRATVNRDLRQIRSALTYALDAGWLVANPLLRWKAGAIVEPEKQIRVVEPEEFNRLHAAARLRDPALALALTVSYYQGLRRAELVKLEWDHVDLERNALAVVNVMDSEDEKLNKNRKNRVSPLRAVVKTALEEHLARVPKVLTPEGLAPKWPHLFTFPDGRPWTADWLSHQFPELVADAGIRHATLHDLRRSFSTLAQRAGMDRALVKDLGGWSCLSVVERHYTGELDERYRDAMQRLDNQAGAG